METNDKVLISKLSPEMGSLPISIVAESRLAVLGRDHPGCNRNTRYRKGSNSRSLSGGDTRTSVCGAFADSAAGDPGRQRVSLFLRDLSNLKVSSPPRSADARTRSHADERASGPPTRGQVPAPVPGAADRDPGSVLKARNIPSVLLRFREVSGIPHSGDGVSVRGPFHAIPTSQAGQPQTAHLGKPPRGASQRSVSAFSGQ